MIESKVPSALLSIVALSAALVALPREAIAADAAAAETLFNEARALVVRGDYDKACPKLEESQRLDAGMGTLFNLADCYEHVGKSASAWAAFLEVASAARVAGQPSREADARARAAAIEPGLAKLVIDVSPAVASTPSLVVKRDAIEVGRPQWGSAVPIDPGKHAFVATAAGKKPWRIEIAIAAGTPSTRVVVPPLEEEAAAPAPPTSTGGVDTAAPSGGSTQRTVGLVMGAVGLVGVGVGSFFGWRSFARHDDSLGHCDSSNLCDAEGVSLRDDARQAGNLSTGMFIAGGVLLVGAVVLYVTAPRSPAGSTAPNAASRDRRSGGESALGLAPGGLQGVF